VGDDPRLQLAKQLMGARLKRLRQEAGVSLSELARLADADRSYVHDIETGTANPTIEVYAKLLSVCGVDFDEFLLGLKSKASTPEHQEVHRLLSVILNSGVKELIQVTRGTLEALAEKAARLKRARSPAPEGEGGKTGSQRSKKGHAG
jgi:transcriptional regulator with XRE-family HTH domain